MNADNGHPLDPIELACLPPDDPQRQELQSRLAAGSAEERATWEREWALTDRLRAALAGPTPPVSLERCLLEIPQNPPPAAQRRSMLNARLNWRAAAAILLLVGLAGVYVMTRQPARPQYLEANLARTLATYAVNKHAGPLVITSSDPAAVEKALAASPTDFPVMLLQPPADSGVTLKGGGIVDFGSAKAAFTQWQGHGTTYTLYEFNGKRFGVPAKFIPTTDVPRDLWTDPAHHYQVFLFAGKDGKCCWALTMETENTPNVFVQFGSAY